MCLCRFVPLCLNLYSFCVYYCLHFVFVHQSRCYQLEVSLLVDEECRRQIGCVHEWSRQLAVLGPYHGVVYSFFRDKSSHRFYARFLGRDSEYLQFVGGVGFSKFDQMRYLHVAWRTPRCPEDDKNIFAFVLAKVVLIAVDVCNPHFRSRFTIKFRPDGDSASGPADDPHDFR